MEALSRLLQLAPQGSRLLPENRRQPKPLGFDADFLSDPNLDPSVRADAGNMAMQGELRNRLGGMRNGGAKSPNEMPELLRMLTGLQADRAAGPIAAQQKEYDISRANEMDSIGQGFTGAKDIQQNTDGSFDASSPMSPMQQREAYKRNFEQQNSPATLQQGQIANQQFMQDRQLNQANRTVSAQMAPSMMDAETRAKYNEALLGGKIDSSGFRGMNRYGPQFTPAPQANPTQLMNNLGDAQGVMDTQNPFSSWDQPTAQQQNFNRRVMSYLQTTGLDPGGQTSLVTVLKDPSYANMTLDDLKRNAMFMDDGVTPDPSFDERDWANWAKAYTYLRAGGQ